MIAYLLRRVWLAMTTIFGVMLLTFLLFRGMAGDIAAARLGQKAPQAKKAEWLHSRGYDRPLLLNVHRRLVITDHTDGPQPFQAEAPDGSGSGVTEALALFLEKPEQGDDEAPDDQKQTLLGRYVAWMDTQTPILEMTQGRSMFDKLNVPREAATTATSQPVLQALIHLKFADGTSLAVDLTGASIAGDIIDAINDHPDNKGRATAGMTDRYPALALLDTQFADHLVKSVTFQARSLYTNEKLSQIIARHAPWSLSVTVPAMALGWLCGLAVASFVAYYRGTALDKVGVFLSVLGMCVPFLAYMVIAQQVMFYISPTNAYGTLHRGNVYVPVLIMVIAGLGGSVRFYRTVMLDETNRDYVRTARAKGVSVAGILFKHVLRNCMLPILTNLIMAIPFLIMGSLLVEKFFGIPGLGDLMINSIFNRDEPIVNTLVFLTAIIYTFGVLLTDISYAVFDPRIRLRDHA